MKIGYLVLIMACLSCFGGNEEAIRKEARYIAENFSASARDLYLYYVKMEQLVCEYDVESDLILKYMLPDGIKEPLEKIKIDPKDQVVMKGHEAEYRVGRKIVDHMNEDLRKAYIRLAVLRSESDEKYTVDTFTSCIFYDYIKADKVDEFKYTLTNLAPFGSYLMSNLVRFEKIEYLPYIFEAYWTTKNKGAKSRLLHSIEISFPYLIGESDDTRVAITEKWFNDNQKRLETNYLQIISGSISLRWDHSLLRINDDGVQSIYEGKDLRNEWDIKVYIYNSLIPKEKDVQALFVDEADSSYVDAYLFRKEDNANVRRTSDFQSNVYFIKGDDLEYRLKNSHTMQIYSLFAKEGEQKDFDWKLIACELVPFTMPQDKETLTVTLKRWFLVPAKLPENKAVSLKIMLKTSPLQVETSETMYTFQKKGNSWQVMKPAE